MKRFWNDYWNLAKESGKFFKHHWFGILTMYVVGFALIFVGIMIPLIPLHSDEIKSKMKKLFRKETESTVEEES